jgi:hypothetical protein
MSRPEVARCSACLGTGYVAFRDSGEMRPCPRCGGASTRELTHKPRRRIEWNAATRSYDVEAHFSLRHHPGTDAVAVEDLPQRVAEMSACRCGAPLSVGNHSLEVADHEVILRGRFYCPRCATTRTVIFSRIAAYISALFARVKHFKISGEGIEITKD